MADEQKLQEQGTQNEGQEVNADPEAKAGQNDGEITMESLMAELAKVKAENAKNKAALDKALHNNGDLTKQLRDKMTASEQEAEAKREEEEARKKELDDLKEFKRRAEARERYITMGMSPDFAKQAADAEVKGDMDAFAAVMKQYHTADIKKHEADWFKQRPDINAGHSEEENELARLEKTVTEAMGL